MKDTPLLATRTAETADLLARLRHMERHSAVYAECLAEAEARTEPIPVPRHGTDRR